MFLIVGLGNPGDKYLNSRHNLGFEVLDELRRKLDLGKWGLESKFKAEVVKNSQLILARPVTYMNMSGVAVAQLAKFFKIPKENIIVVHDELDLLVGHMKIRIGGSDAGHHGVESIINNLGAEDFIRVRLGIGADKTLSGEHKLVGFNAEKFVMELFHPKEKSQVKSMIKRAIKAIEAILEKGVEKAQNQFN
jgi:peptidyl-tRNA hydrolase, PTH1 family